MAVDTDAGCGRHSTKPRSSDVDSWERDSQPTGVLTGELYKGTLCTIVHVENSRTRSPVLELVLPGPGFARSQADNCAHSRTEPVGGFASLAFK